MAFSNIDRTAEVEKQCNDVLVESTDFCSYYERHPDTLLQRKECWTCNFGDFGIELNTPTDKGICRFKKKVGDTL